MLNDQLMLVDGRQWNVEWCWKDVTSSSIHQSMFRGIWQVVTICLVSPPRLSGGSLRSGTPSSQQKLQAVFVPLPMVAGRDIEGHLVWLPHILEPATQKRWQYLLGIEGQKSVSSHSKFPHVCSSKLVSHGEIPTGLLELIWFLGEANSGDVGVGVGVGVDDSYLQTHCEVASQHT